MSIKLSVCIATLNRAAFIGATLESIIRQATDEVEIVIVDGASTDNTTRVVQQFQERFSRLRYRRLESKGGVDRDYDRAVQMAQGEYCWLMTDDDLLKPGAIQAVLTAIQKDYSLIVVNAEARNADLSRLLVPQRLLSDTDRVYESNGADQQRLLADVGFYLTFIGGVVIQRQLWNTRDHQSFWGTEFIHLGVIFQAPLPGATLVLSSPWIVIRYGNAQWTARYFEIWMFKLPSLIWALPFDSDAAKQKVCRKEPWRRMEALLLFRARGVYSLNEYRLWIAPQPGSRWSKFIARTIAQLPGGVVNALAGLYARARHHQLLAVDLMNSPFYYRSPWTHWLENRTRRSSSK